MGSIQFAYAKSIHNRSKKYINDLRKQHATTFDDDNFDTVAARAEFIERQRAEYRDILQIYLLLNEDFKQVTDCETHNWFFVTIRPKPGIAFEAFYTLTHKWINRAFMDSYTLSFEQKGTDGSGDGFHVHVVCTTNHKSKGQCLRDTISTFRQVCEDNCIDVKTTKNPKDIINNYLIEYKSDDAHKEATKEGDKIWRRRVGLRPCYSNMESTGWDPLPSAISCLSSPKTAKNIPSGPVIVELD